jgi:hypothetical protein
MSKDNIEKNIKKDSVMALSFMASSNQQEFK